ncbi:MAG: GGDEF domain-containing protein, partial [Aquabacterium sp.]|nr:GGDEF domain-containing protein [Aquabacterium sp.]
VAIAQRLRAVVRETDAVVRLGGDEFVVVLHDLDRHETAHRIAQALVETASQPVELTVATVQVGASVGISYCPEHASEREGLLKAADAAMYAAKAGGRGIWRVAAWPNPMPAGRPD